MSQESRIEVINREGWRKEYPLQKGIVYIGSAPTNDIVLGGLHGVGVAPLHAQLIAAGAAGYKLVNLSDQEILLGSGGNEALPPRAVMNLPEGTTLRLGEFTLIFRGGAGVNYGGINNGSGSANIGLRLSLPYTRLVPNQTLAGTATIRNLGGKTGARFDVVLEGLDEDCFDIEPGPLLSSGAEKDVSFRLYHHGARPLAGEWTFVVRATSNNAYPGEQAQVFQTIEVLPLYQHRLRLWPVKGVKVTTPPEEKTTPLRNTLKAKEERSRPQPEPEAVQEEWWATSEAGDEPAAAQRPEVRRLKAQAVAPPPVQVTPVEPESDAPSLATTAALAALADKAREDWGWTVKVETQPQSAPPVVVPLEPPAPQPVEPEPAIFPPEAAEPPVFPPPIPEPEIETFRPVEAEAAPVAAPPPVFPVEVQAAPAEKQPPPEPVPPQVQPGAEPSQFNKWWSRLKEAVPFRSRAVEPAPPAQPVEAAQPPSPAIESYDQQAPPAEGLAEEPQETTVIAERPYLATAEPEPQAEVAPPLTSYTEPAGEIEGQPEVEPQAEELTQAEVSAVEPVSQAPELPVEEPTSEPEMPPPPEESKPAFQTTEFEDWWADDIEPAPPVEVSPASPPEAQPEAESPAKSDEWWETIEIKTRVKTEENPVIKLKANPSQVKQPEIQAKTTEAEEWWAVDAETSPEQADKKS